MLGFVTTSEAKDLLTTIHANLDKWFVGFITGAISSLLWPTLPDPIYLSLILLAACCLLFNRYAKGVSGLLVGIVWIASVGHWQVHWQLPADKIITIQRVTGTVMSLGRDAQSIRFNLKISKIDNQSVASRPIVRLSWLDPQWQLKQGQVVSLRVKLKPVHGMANQGGFLYHQWLISQRINATGYIKKDPHNILLDSEVTLRQQWIDRLSGLNLRNEKWIAALSFGDRSLFDDADWQLVQHTGVAHLIAISGLHLGIVAGLAYWLSGIVLTIVLRTGLFSQSFNYLHWQIPIMLAITLFYASLAGFGLPTIRAWLMLMLLACLIMTYKNWPVRHLLLYSLVIFIVLFPLSILTVSFWLSFAAVIIIWWVLWRWPSRKSDKQQTSKFGRIISAALLMLRIQLSLNLFMLPLIAWQFSFVSTLSPLVNLLAVPFVSLILVPACLLASLSLIINDTLAHWLFSCIDYVIDLSIQGLEWVAKSFDGVFYVPDMPLNVWLLITIALVWILSPQWSAKRPWALVLSLPLISYLSITPVQQHWQVNVMDVGQGLAIVIIKDRQALVYDVGASYPSGFNMADAVLVPFLATRGIYQIELVVISHFDNDHAGSLSSLKAALPITQIISTSDQCSQGVHHQWQGLDLQVMWPVQTSEKSDNDSSCVIRVTDGQYSVMLTGDISVGVEQYLVDKFAGGLDSDVLIAAHHGSATSSSKLFINTVKPDIVVFSQGFMNRWDFPRQSVVNLYQQANVTMYATSESGQIQITFDPAGDPALEQSYQIRTFRDDIYPRWFN